MTAEQVAILRLDAARVAELVAKPGRDKGLRQRARQALWKAYAVLEAHERAEALAEPGVDLDDPTLAAEEPLPEPAEILAILQELERLLRQMGDAAGAGARPLREVLVRQPMPERVPLPASAVVTGHLTRQVEGHFRVRVALTPSRLKWFDARCNESDPTRIATVRQPESKTGDEREALELIHKNGRTRFS